MGVTHSDCNHYTIITKVHCIYVCTPSKHDGYIQYSLVPMLTDPINSMYMRKEGEPGIQNHVSYVTRLSLFSCVR